ncbi:uncharacterized protein Z518_02793 [Rhinocladiella mackenziei CBS 650.93]|uniref:CoA-transferase family III n=1 Tax=Rhinocladiella mackenziei CBS 650.93 TaxID=1442369 RepID=A0A0D2G0U7_9EURO|nr:uncharacterized protein Z518_02793 [Rhinocladiella mackenziei CBS 650.93]KIX08137.1 hypothetical protein Z518_02793 [Rhinocladiella mackenziei CBS 650.93]
MIVPNPLGLYSVPEEAGKVFIEGIANNPKLTSLLPEDVFAFASRIKLVGNDSPSIPINWRFAESATALKMLEACMIAKLVEKKYGTKLSGATINTDHASLFLMSTLLYTVYPDTEDAIPGTLAGPELARLDAKIPNYDFRQMQSSRHRICATSIYKTKDHRYFHIHGSMDPNPTLESIGLPMDSKATTWEEARAPFIEKLSQIDSQEMQRLATDVYGQAGVICESISSFRDSEHGKANAHVALFEIHDAPNPAHPPSWWPDSPQTSSKRPLAGLKVVDLTRVIAAPAVTRGLAELGASVMRVTSPNLVDYSYLHIDLNWGKWNSSVDLKTEEGKKLLRDLILDADVVIQGYRPGVLDKYGFSQQAIIDLVASSGRERGIISARENCYGWNGPWSQRSGWQQISDACTGVSWAFGKAMGLENGEPVTPVFPNSDYMTGIAGVVAILTALLRRADKGGSYKVDLALNYYNQWLVESVGEYPAHVWEDVWSRHGKKIFRCYHNMPFLVPAYIEMLRCNSSAELFDPKFFEDRYSGAIDAVIRTVRPIIQFDKDEVELKYNVGTRGNGKDTPRWPQDLGVEVVS